MSTHAPASTLPAAAPGVRSSSPVEDPEESWLGLSPYWSFRLQALLRGLPAFFGLIAVVSVSLYGMVNRQKVEMDYQVLAASAMKSKEYRLAELCLERTIDLGNDTDQARYQLAMALWQRGKIGRARATMNELAPEDGKGYAPAHLFMAHFVLAAGKNSKEAQERSEMHLIRTIELDETIRSAHLMLFQLYVKQKKYLQAEDFLKRGDKLEPVDQMTKAGFYRQWSKAVKEKDPKAAATYEERAQVEATRAAEGLDQWLAADPENHGHRIKLARVHMFLDEPQKAIDLLREGHKRRPSAVYARLLSEAYYQWALETKDPGKKIELLIGALTQDKDNARIYPELIKALDDKKTAEVVSGALEELLVDARGGNRAFLHLLLGNLARSRGDTKNAELHFNMGIHSGGPAAALVANNFALHLALREKKPDFDRAQELINSALKQYPKHPRLIDTRGRIYLKMGRLKDAIKDLEFAVSDGRIADKEGLYRAIRDTYKGLGNKRMEEQYAQKLKQLEFRKAELIKERERQKRGFQFASPDKDKDTSKKKNSGQKPGSGTKKQ